MTVLTWSFNSGFNGWEFDNPDPNTLFSPCGACNPCPGCVATRTHIVGAIRHNITVDSVANVTTIARETLFDVDAAILNGDTIDLDYSATSDAAAAASYIRAYYTDATYEEASVADTIAGTLTLTMTQNKTLDQIQVFQGRSTSGTAIGSVFTINVEEIRLTTATALTPTPGKLKTPTSFIDNEGAGAAGGAGGDAGGNIAAISADGLYIYIASFNNLGFPTLVRMPAALSADGTVLFDPLAGGRIGVQAALFNTQHVWVAGQFDGTNTLEKSEDYGVTWTVKDDATFGTIRTFVVGPDSDDRILIFDADNGDLIESLDGGATWTTINAAVAVSINSLARFDLNPQEIVAGNQGGANNSINYSPNTGVDLEDYQTGVYPNANATKVIAN